MSDSGDTSNRRPSRHLLVPSFPTPNGRLHLGHIAGPYLRCDVLARHLRRGGADVTVACGTDAYEHYVLLRAIDERRAPNEVAADYARQIKADLAALDIVVDLFIDPLEQVSAADYAAIQYAVVGQLVADKRARIRAAPLHYAAGSGRYLTGPWLLGECPACGADAGGSSCEACGANFEPHEIRRPRGRLDAGPFESRETPALFLDLDVAAVEAISQAAAGLDLGPDFAAIVERQLARVRASGGFAVRLTLPGDYGLPWPADRNPTDDFGPQVLNSYGSLFAFSLLLGRTTGGNAFDVASGVQTVSFIGKDTVVNRLLKLPAVAGSLPQYKAYDRVVPNHFYLLDGEKFSTSRRHAIWAGELVDRTPISADAARYFLCATSPTRAETNFDVNAFVAFFNDKWRTLLSNCRRAAAVASPGGGPTPSLKAALDGELREQHAALDGQPLDPARAAATIDRWVQMPAPSDPAAAYWWLKGLALLAWPVLPRTAADLWAWLGQAGAPSVASFDHLPSSVSPGTPPLPDPPPLTRALLDPVLPAGLRSTV